MSSETFCAHNEGSLSHLDVEGRESLACASLVAAYT